MYVMHNFPLVMSIEYVAEKRMKTVAYVQLLQMPQKFMNKKDILDKGLSKQEYKPHEYRCRDDSSFREYVLLSCDEFRTDLSLYIDNF